MKVFEVMTKKIISIKEENTILDAMKLMRETDLGFLVIKEDKKAIGVVTDRDIVLQLAKEISISTKINKIMKKYVITVNQNEDASIASDIMGYMQVKRLVVVDDNDNMVGIITLADLLRHPLTEELALESMIEISYNYPTNNDKEDKTIQTNAFIL